MNRLSRDQILQAQDAKYEDVAVPEWGGTVRIKALTAGDRDEYENAVMLDAKGDMVKRREDVRAKLVLFCAVDDAGNRLFTERDVKELSAKSAKAMNRLWEAGSRLAGIGAEDVKELEKN